MSYKVALGKLFRKKMWITLVCTKGFYSCGVNCRSYRSRSVDSVVGLYLSFHNYQKNVCNFKMLSGFVICKVPPFWLDFVITIWSVSMRRRETISVCSAHYLVQIEIVLFRKQKKSKMFKSAKVWLYWCLLSMEHPIWSFIEPRL